MPFLPLNRINTDCVTNLEESNPKGDPCNDSQVGLHHPGHQWEAALRSIKTQTYWGAFFFFFFYKPSMTVLNPFLTHHHVHFVRSLIEVFQVFWCAVAVDFTAAGRDAVVFKVLGVAPVSEIPHPTALQLQGTINHNKKAVKRNSWRIWPQLSDTTCSDKPERAALCFSASFSNLLI